MTAERIDGSAGTAVHGARPYWLAEPCPVWCDKLHDEQAFEADRRHLSSGYLAQVVLSTEDPVVQGARLGDRAQYFPAELVLYLDQHVREVGPRVVIDQVPAERRQLYLLPVEARQVGEALIRLAGLAREDGRGGSDPALGRG